MADKETCETCRFWLSNEELGTDAGICRRFPPQIYWDEEVDGDLHMQPDAFARDWCGEYQQSLTPPPHTVP